MNRARSSSRRKQIACSGCHLTRDHSAATTRGVGVISPTRAVIRGTPSPVTLYGKSRPTGNDLFGAAHGGLTIGTRKKEGVQVHCGKS